MPLNKNQGLRFEIIEGLLKKRHGYKVDELHELVNKALIDKGYIEVTSKTIRNDMDMLESVYGIEIIKEKGRYKYADAKDSYRKPRVESGDQETLALGLEAFSSLDNLPFFNKFSDVVNRLLAGNLYEGIQGEEKNRIIQIGESYNDSGYQYIEKIYHAIKNKKAIRVLYTNNAGVTNWRIISPYLLKEYRNQWYMVGYTKDSSRGPSSSVFALSKIDSLSYADDQQYVIDPDFNADDYFRYCLGVYHDLYHQPILVQLKFFGADLVQYFKNYKLHSTMQIIAKNEQDIVISIEVYNQIELKSLILSYGDKVEVIQPRSLRKEIKQMAERMINLNK